MLNVRLKMILDLIVKEYILTAEPVGSKTLVNKYGLDLSAATIRKVMSELEEKGLLNKAHSSAGRTPTELGLQVYVDEILQADTLSKEIKDLIDNQIGSKTLSHSEILSICSRVLSDITKNMAVVIAPNLTNIFLKKLYFLKLGAKEVLAVLVASDASIKNIVIYPSHDYCQDELNEVNNYLSENCLDISLNELKEKALKMISMDKQDIDILYHGVLELSAKALNHVNDDKQAPIYIEGGNNLIDNPDFTGIRSLRAIFKAFEKKTMLVDLLNEIANEGKSRVVIASEKQASELEGLALVAAPYSTKENQPLGAVGVLGPQRLNYSKIVPVVEYTAKVVSGLFEKK